MNIKFYALTFIICLLLFNCKTAQKNTIPIIILNKEYDIVTEFSSKSKIFGFREKYYFNEQGDLMLNSLTWPDWNLYQANITQGNVLDTIDCNIYPHQSLEDFHFVSPDTILLAFNATYLGDYYDKALVFIDRNKKIIDTVSLSGAPFLMEKGQIIDLKQDTRYWMNYRHFPLIYRNGKIYCPMATWWANSECSSQRNLIGIVSHNPSGPFKRLPVNLECAPEQYVWGHDYRLPSGAFSEDFLYASFGNSSILYQYNEKTEKTKSARIPFVTIDTITPYLDGSQYPSNYDGYKSQFLDLIYNPRNEQLIWTTRIGCDSTDSPICTKVVNFVYTFAFIDKNLQKTGEGIIPEEYTYQFIPYKDGFLLPKKMCDTLTFGYFTYSIIEGDSSFLKKQIRERRNRMNAGYEKLPFNQMLAKYLKEVAGESTPTYKKAILIPESSCPACQPAYARLFSKYQDKLLEKNIAVVLIYDDPEKMDEFIKLTQPDKKKVKWETSDQPLTLYKDTSQKYLPYFAMWVNLRYIEFDELGNVKQDKIINPGDLKDFEKMITE